MGARAYRMGGAAMSMRKRLPSRARAGESMIMVIVMLLVFFLLGAAVLTAASTAAAGASARVIERQGYYYARSQMDAIDTSLQSGALGKMLIKAALRDCTANGGTSAYTASKPLTMRFTPSYDSAPLTELNGTEDKHDVVITCTGTVQKGNSVTAIRMRTVDMEFVCTYRGMDTRMHVRYQWSCNVANFNEESNEGTWHSDWTVLQVG